MIFERCFSDRTGSGTRAAGIDVVAMSGVTFKRAFELCAQLDRAAIALQDNDGTDPDEIRVDLSQYLSDERRMFVGAPANGHTLEPQLINKNGADRMRAVLGLRNQDNPATWMPNHKTEGALRILEHESETIEYPDYIVEAVDHANE